MYTQGLNQYIFHRNAMQPHPTAVPGMTMGPWGWECDRTNTLYDGLDRLAPVCGPQPEYAAPGDAGG